MPLDEDVDLGQTGHIADHETIHAAINALPTTYKSLPLRTARAYLTSTTAITTSTNTTVALGSETYDTNALHDTATNNSRIVLNAVGRWLVIGQASWNAGTGGGRQVRVHLNGSLASYVSEPPNPDGTSGLVQQSVSLVEAAVITDYVELVVWHSRGSNLDLFGGAAETWLLAAHLGT